MISDEDFAALRNHYGEKVTLYFAFTQFYCLSLIPLTVFGMVTWMFLPQYHPSFAVGLGLWTITFKHTWERRQRELAIKWGVKGFARLVEQRRAAFVSEGVRMDPVTGEKVKWYPKYTSRLASPLTLAKMEELRKTNALYPFWTCIGINPCRVFDPCVCCRDLC